MYDEGKLFPYLVRRQGECSVVVMRRLRDAFTLLNQQESLLNNMTPLCRVAVLTLRVALALAFLSAVADRFGLWGPPGSPNVAWGTFDSFIEYTGLLLWFLPPAVVHVCGWIATALEVVFAVGLLSGYCVRWFALASALLMLSFAITMTIAMGLEPAFSYSVWTASASAFLLACVDVSKPAAPGIRG